MILNVKSGGSDSEREILDFEVVGTWSAEEEGM